MTKINWTPQDAAKLSAKLDAARAMLAALEKVVDEADEAVCLGTMSGGTASRILLPVSHAIAAAKAAGIK